jgi:hypothetical protein
MSRPMTDDMTAAANITGLMQRLDLQYRCKNLSAN